MAKDTLDHPNAPRVFISYSWSSPEHKQWVLGLAIRLVNDGVDVILDEWDLREGQDKYAFMEQMVTDPSVTKVLAICDKQYAEKADGRARRNSGVGDESQIISPEVYRELGQRKFIPVVTEYDQENKACTPTFFTSRMYIDMSSPENTLKNHETLLRAIFDKPLNPKPALGKPPTYLSEEAKPASRTRHKLEVLRLAATEAKANFSGSLQDYLVSFREALEDHRIERGRDGLLDEKVVKSISELLPYRDEFIDLMLIVSLFRDDERTYTQIHSFFEDSLRYLHDFGGLFTFETRELDNYRFFLHELFLYSIAALVKNDRYEQANVLLSRGYLARLNASQAELQRFAIFSTSSHSLELDRKGRLGLHDDSLTGHLIHERITRPELNAELLIETDFILHLRSLLEVQGQTYHPVIWFWTLMPFRRYHRDIDIFVKAQSGYRFERLKLLLGVNDKDDFAEKLLTLDSKLKGMYLRMTDSRSIKQLIGFDKLATLP